jgi:hypothetical protein
MHASNNIQKIRKISNLEYSQKNINKLKHKNK